MNGNILVVGAGLAGLSAAVEYLEAGGRGRVTILEAMKRPNELHPGSNAPGAGHCSGSGGLGQAMLRQIGWHLSDDIIMADINNATISGPTESVTFDGASIGTPGEKIGIVTNKHKFGDWLLERAMKLGAEYLPGQRVTSASRYANRWNLTTQNAVYEADFLIGTDGPNSLVAQTCFNAPPYDPDDVFTASEVYLKTPSHPNDKILIEFAPSIISGYFWRFGASRNGDGLTKVGCGFTTRRKQNPSQLTTWYREKSAQETGDVGYLDKPVRYIGGKISGSMPLPVVCDPKRRVAVAGEAGRMVMASIGAGDSMAVESGRALGRSVADGHPERYQKYYAANLRPYLRRHYRVKNALLSLNDANIDRGVRLLRNYKPKSTNTRKEVTRMMRWLIMADPFFVGRFAVRALLP